MQFTFILQLYLLSLLVLLNILAFYAYMFFIKERMIIKKLIVIINYDTHTKILILDKHVNFFRLTLAILNMLLLNLGQNVLCANVEFRLWSI